MSLLLLDTTFLIDADRVGDSLDSIIEDDDDVAISTITVAELRVGVALSRGRARTTRQAFVDDVLAAVPVLSYDLAVAAAHAELLVAVRKQGRRRGAHDLMIAATAKATQRTVLSADANAFTDLPGGLSQSHR
jgi:tRNA(fMet)-specific endonuclease VapC